MPFSTIRIREYAFELVAPYGAGSQLDEDEARALNGLRAENIRNNVSKFVAQALSEASANDGDSLLSEAALATLSKRISDYADAYRFPNVKIVARPGLIECEAMLIAKERLAAHARSSGQMLPDDHEFELEALDKEMALAEVQRQARERVAIRQQVAQRSLEDLLG